MRAGAPVPESASPCKANLLQVWKPAVEQAWKPALRGRLLALATRFGRILWLLALIILPFLPNDVRAQAEGDGDATAVAAAYYHRLYDEARKGWQNETNRADVAWKFAAACFDWAEFASSASQRADIAQEGIQAARRAIVLEPETAAGYYYLALDLGQLAQTKSLGALRLVNEMERSFKRSAELEPAFDFAGAYRSLGMLYRDAPGWPTSVGDRGKARSHFKKAVDLSPDYPDNQLTYIESLLIWGDKKIAVEQIAAVEPILKKARDRFTGGEWRFVWPDWDKRWEKLKSRAGVVAARSPKGTSAERERE